jgi:hypothetical protein
MKSMAGSDLPLGDPVAGPWLPPLHAIAVVVCRLVRFDKPGTGLSDPVAEPPTLDERVAWPGLARG